MSKACKPPSTRAILIYFEFRSKPSLIAVICMNRHTPNKLFATKYCFFILGDDSSFFFLIISLFFVFFVILLLLIFTKTMLLLSFYFINFFFIKIIFIFSCSGMFRNVPECSVSRVLSTPKVLCLQNLTHLKLGLISGYRRHCTTRFSEDVLVVETSYQMLEVLAFCDRERA